MSKKKLIERLLAKLSESDLEELLGDEVEESPPVEELEPEPEPATSGRHTINRRRGGGHSKIVGSKKKTKAKTKGKSKKKKGRGKGNACKVSSMDVSGNRPNKFDDFIQNVKMDHNEKEEMATAKESDKIQKKNTVNFKGPKRNNNLVDVECSVCDEEYEVSANIVNSLDSWKCNSCACHAG